MPAPTTHLQQPCGACGRPILWALTARGARQAVDPEPNENGNTAVYRDDLGRIRARGLTAERPTPEHLEWRVKPHAATCPNPQPRSPARTSRRRPRVQPTGWPR